MEKIELTAERVINACKMVRARSQFEKQINKIDDFSSELLKIQDLAANLSDSLEDLIADVERTYNS